MIISDKDSNLFIRHYYVTSKMLSLESMNFAYTFSSGRRLEFHKTPYCHSVGSFITHDLKSGVLFTSDLFGAVSRNWRLFVDLDDECRKCRSYFDGCSVDRGKCPLLGIVNFHRRLMTSNRALRYAMRVIADIPAAMIAPQHGGVFRYRQDIAAVMRALMELEDVGVDGLPGAKETCDVARICAAYCEFKP